MELEAGGKMIVTLIIWLCLGIICAVVANRNHRSAALWFALGLLGGVISLIILGLLVWLKPIKELA